MPENPKLPHAECLASEVIRTDDKTLYVDLKENYRGRHFRITEVTHGRRTAIVLPLAFGPALAAALMNLSKHALTLPPPN